MQTPSVSGGVLWVTLLDDHACHKVPRKSGGLCRHHCCHQNSHGAVDTRGIFEKQEFFWQAHWQALRHQQKTPPAGADGVSIL